MKTITQPTWCATCGNNVVGELREAGREDAPSEFYYQFQCHNPDCPQFEQDGFVRVVENPSA